MARRSARGLRDVVAGAAAEVPGPEPEPELEPEAAAVLAAPSEVTFTLGGVKLTSAEVRDAVAALRACPGNRVLPAFQNAGHRLAGAGKKWYLVFADEVMDAYPELRVPPKRHSEGHFGRVKQALVFGLERFLDTVPEPAVPEPPAVPGNDPLWAELESVLWRLPGFGTDDVDTALEMVRQLAAA